MGRQAGDRCPAAGNSNQGIVKGVMVESAAAQRGVVQAIVSLHDDQIFTGLLDDLLNSVFPKYLALDSPIEEAPVFNQPAAGQTAIGRYTKSSHVREQRNREFDNALHQWARRFRLTDNLARTGEPLSWILEFGRRTCKDRTFTIPSARPAGKRPPPPSGLPVDWPKPNERCSEWLARIRPALRAWYQLTRKQQRSRSYPDPAKRNKDHYRWFVLRVCGGITPGKITELLGIPAADESTIRKGIMKVREALGLVRK
jgi:hypothetical protein